MPKIKVCGMKYSHNIKEVAALQPDYLGFIFYEKSPRYFSGEIPEIPSKIKKIGVFVNAKIPFILDKIQLHNLQLIQLHGDEDIHYVQHLKEQITKAKLNVKIIKVFGIKESFDFNQLKFYEKEVDYFLFDTQGKERGGNGISFNWKILKKYPSDKPYFLSGGIDIDAVDKIKKINPRPFALDINSKFEVKAGEKNPDKINQLKKELESKYTKS